MSVFPSKTHLNSPLTPTRSLDVRQALYTTTVAHIFPHVSCVPQILRKPREDRTAIRGDKKLTHRQHKSRLLWTHTGHAEVKSIDIFSDHRLIYFYWQPRCKLQGNTQYAISMRNNNNIGS